MDVLVLDIKFGIGAFMKEESRAKALAEKMVGVPLTVTFDMDEIDKPKALRHNLLYKIIYHIFGINLYYSCQQNILIINKKKVNTCILYIITILV